MQHINANDDVKATWNVTWRQRPCDQGPKQKRTFHWNKYWPSAKPQGSEAHRQCSVVGVWGWGSPGWREVQSGAGRGPNNIRKKVSLTRPDQNPTGAPWLKISFESIVLCTAGTMSSPPGLPTPPPKQSGGGGPKCDKGVWHPGVWHGGGDRFGGHGHIQGDRPGQPRWTGTSCTVTRGLLSESTLSPPVTWQSLASGGPGKHPWGGG